MWCVPCTIHPVFLELANYLGLPWPWKINKNYIRRWPVNFLSHAMRFPEELLVFMMRIFLVQPVPRSLCTAYTAWLKVRMITRGQMLRDFLDDFSHTSSIGFIWQCLIWKWQEEHIKHEPKTTSSKTASVTWVVTWTVTYIILHTSSPNTNPGLKRPPIGVNYI